MAQNPVGYKPYRPLTKRKMDQHSRFNPKQPMPAKHLPSLRYSYGLYTPSKPGKK